MKGCRRAFQSACKKAGIKEFTFHDLRHTCASWLVQGDVHLLSVRDVLGHRTTAMTERYAHMDNQKIHDAVAVLDEFRSHSGHTTLIKKEPLIPKVQSQIYVERSTGPALVIGTH